MNAFHERWFDPTGSGDSKPMHDLVAEKVAYNAAKRRRRAIRAAGGRA